MTEPLVNERSRTKGADFERALTFAEAMLERLGQKRLLLRSILLAQLAACGVGAVVALVLLSALLDPTLRAVAAGLAFALPLLGTALSSSMLIPLLRHEIIRDERAMTEVIDHARGLVSLVEDDESWSAAQRSFVDARIARFSIGRG